MIYSIVSTGGEDGNDDIYGQYDKEYEQFLKASEHADG
jgi:hypothetical protein